MSVWTASRRHAGARSLLSLLLLLVALFLGGMPRAGRHQDSQPRFPGRQAGRQEGARGRAADEAGIAAALGPEDAISIAAHSKPTSNGSRRSIAIADFPTRASRSFDVKLNDKQDQVDVVVNISEGQPTLVAGDRTDRLRRPARASCGPARLAAAAGEDSRSIGSWRSRRASGRSTRCATTATRTRRSTSRSRAPVATTGRRSRSRRRRARWRISVRLKSRARRASATTSFAGSSRSSPGELFTRREMRETQRKLYGMELFQFANIESKEDKAQQLLRKCRRASRWPRASIAADDRHRLRHRRKRRARRCAGITSTSSAARGTPASRRKWSSLDRGVRVDYTEPYFFARTSR